MKRFFTFLLIAAGAAPALYSQITMTKASHGFLSGQNHECQAVQYQAPGTSGTNCVWDFSKAVALNDTKSTAALSEENSVLGTIKAARNDGCDFFFNTTESANEYWGYQSGNTKFQLTEPIVKTKYPQTFGTQFSGNYAGTVTVEGTNYSSPVSGSYSTNVDGIGTVILPGDVSYPALRVKTTEGNASFERVKYLWYAQNVRLPLFVTLEDYSIAADGTRKLTATESYLNTQVQSQSNAQTTADAFSYSVSPNPFRNEIQVTYTLAEKSLVTIALYASGGAELTTLVPQQVQSGSQTVSKDVSQYAKLPGVYLLKITAGDKVYTEKLLKY
jgi:hypothetical protein